MAKAGSGTCRDNPAQGILNRIKARGIPLIACEPVLEEADLFHSPVVRDLTAFKNQAGLIPANRHHPELDIAGKLFTRDLFGGD